MSEPMIQKPTILRNDLEEKHAEDDPWPLEKVDSALSTTIVRDYTTKHLMFHGMLLNYTESDQMNINPSGESSIGKSHIALSVAALFPEEDVEPLGYCSQKSFFHDHGAIINDFGDVVPPRNEYVDRLTAKWIKKNPRPDRGAGVSEWRADLAAERRKLKTEWDDEPKKFLVDLHQRILIFKDMPQSELLVHLRSLLSHDQKNLHIKIAPRGNEMERTQDIVLRGYPTVVFCMADALKDAQEQTRFLILSPEDTQEKLGDSLDMLAQKLRDPGYYQQGVDADVLRNKLKADILAIKKFGATKILIREEHMTSLLNLFKSKRRGLMPRDQRDFPHVVRIGKARALLNLANRNQLGTLVVAEGRDLLDSVFLFDKIHESVKYGIPPHIYDFYKALIKGEEGIQTRRELQERYLKKFRRSLGKDRLGTYIESLATCGLVAEIVGEDKRFRNVQDIGEGASPPDEPDTPLQEVLTY